MPAFPHILHHIYRFAYNSSTSAQQLRNLLLDDMKHKCCEPGIVFISTGEEVFLGQIPRILPDVHVVKLGSISGLYLDILSHFSAGENPVTLEGAEDRIEAALFDLVPAFQSLNHFPVR